MRKVQVSYSERARAALTAASLLGGMHQLPSTPAAKTSLVQPAAETKAVGKCQTGVRHGAWWERLQQGEGIMWVGELGKER